MIKIVLSSSLNMSKRYAETIQGIGVTPESFSQIVTDLYNHPLFLFNNRKIYEEEFYKKDIALYNSILKGNYFYNSRDFMGSRKLILNALSEIRLSVKDTSGLKLPVKEKGDSLLELYNNLYKDNFDYSQVVQEVIARVEEGHYGRVFKNIQLVILDKPQLTGYENKLYDFLTSRIETTCIENKNEPEFNNTTCKSSITKSGNINHLFKWMKDYSLTTADTVLIALDYDETAAQFYGIKDQFPVYFSKGLRVSALSMFEPLLTGISEIRSAVKDDTDFFDKVEKSLYKKEHIFYKKSLQVVQSVKKYSGEYTSAGIKIDVLNEIIDGIEGIYLTQEELGLEKKGLHITTLDDIYTLDLKNIAVMGLSHGNYPHKVKMDPILKQDEREAANSSTGGSLNIMPPVKENMLEILLTKVSGKTFLSYVSHSDGKLAVPSIFFNKILASRNMAINVENIYNLCGVKEGYIDDLLDQKGFLDISAIDGQLERIISYKKELYSPDEIDSDYGTFDIIKKNLSATSLTNYFQCPYRFNLQYNLKLKFPDLGQSDLSQWLDSGKRGELIHQLYEGIVNQFITTGTTEYESFLKSLEDSDIDDFFDKQIDLFLEEKRDKGEVPNSDVPNSDVPNSDVPNSDVPNSDVPQYIKDRELKEIKENFISFIEKEIDNSDEFYPLKAEVEFNNIWKIGENEITFYGFIDRIDTDGNGNYRIWDYKTGKNPYDFDSGYLFRVDNKWGPKLNFQHALYLKALQDMEDLKNITSVEAGYYYTSDAGGWSKVTYSGSDPVEKQSKILGEYLEQCSTGKYYKNPGNCKFCDYKSICSNNQSKRKKPLEERYNTLISVLEEDNE